MRPAVGRAISACLDAELGFWLAALGLAAGPALLGTFLLLGRPPLSLPTLRGTAAFALLGLVMSAAWRAELTLGGGTHSWRGVLAGYAPLALAGPLAALLYVPTVNHWFVTVPSVRPALGLAVLVPTLCLKIALVAVAHGNRIGRWCWRRRYAVVGSVYAAVALAAKPGLWHTDLAGWFVPATRLVLTGQPLAIYSVRADVMGTAAPIEHGPLTILFYAPFVAMAELLGNGDFLRLGALFPLAGVLVVDCLMAYQVTRAMADLAPSVSEEQRFGAFVLILFSPLVWFSSVWLVHLESLQALLLVCAVRLLMRGRSPASGVLLGLSLLIKHSAALSVLPLLVVLFVAQRRGLALMAGGMAAVVAAAGLLPLLLAAPADFWFNFGGYDAIKPIYGVTIWKALYDTGLEPLAMRYDSVLIGVLALGGAVATGVAARRWTTTGGERWGVWAYCWVGVFLGQCAWLGLTTWQYPHYFLSAFVALLIWETTWNARSDAATDGVTVGTQRWPVLSLLVLFVPYSLQSHMPNNVGKAGGAFVVARAAAQLAFLYGCAVAVWVRLRIGAQRRALASDAAAEVEDATLLAAER